MKTHILLPALGALCCCFSSAAHADLKWTETMTFSGGGGAAQGMPPGMGKMGVTTTNWASKDAERTETVTKMGPIEMSTAELSRCDTKEKFLLDSDSKMYAPKAADADGMPDMSGMPGMPGMGRPGAARTPGKGTMAMEFAIKDLGKETVAGIETRHYSVNIKTTSTGCAGNGTTDVAMETWVADIRMPAACQQGDYKSNIGAAMHLKAACDVTQTYKGDTALMKSAFDGFVMRMKVSGGPGGGFVKEVTQLSQAALDATPFTIPADWTKTTEQALQQAQQRNMMKKMMGGLGAMGGMGGDAGDVPDVPDAGDNN